MESGAHRIMNTAYAERQARDRALFDAISDEYCRKDLSPASRRARRLRLERTLSSVPLGPSDRVLEIGCGAGFAARYLRGRYRGYTGIDPSSQLIALARQYNARPDVRFEVADLGSMDVGERFDVVFSIGVLHHIPGVERLMPQVGALLRSGGWLAVNEPQPGNPLIRRARAIRKRLQESYSEEQDELSHQQLTDLLERAGLSEIQITPQGLLSTPFAEVVLKPGWLARPLSTVACVLDPMLERLLGPLGRRICWNLIAIGRKP